jgi:hypothetical protein
MNKNSNKPSFFTRTVCYTCFALTLVSCDRNDPKPETGQQGAFFISATGESAQYVLRTDNPATGTIPISDNVATLELAGYTWIFNPDPSFAVGLIYQQGSPGIGLGFSLTSDGSLKESGQFLINSRFTSYGFFGRYALTCVGGVTPADEYGNALTDSEGKKRTDGVTFNIIDLKNNFALQEKTITTLNITGNGGQATLSGIVDVGDEFLSALVVSKPKDPNQSGGSSTGTVTYPDSVWIAAFDSDLTLKRIYRSDLISYASGRYRSQYYSQIAKAGDGNVYVFSGSYETSATRPAGALRINAGGESFDPSYYFNIEEKTEGYKFRKVWNITGNCFLLELYNELTPTTTGAATQYGIVNVSDKTFRWLAGIPAKDKITATGLPCSDGGKMYFPISAEAEDPAIYIIDPSTATATKGLTITGATSINAIGKLTVR